MIQPSINKYSLLSRWHRTINLLVVGIPMLVASILLVVSVLLLQVVVLTYSWSMTRITNKTLSMGTSMYSRKRMNGSLTEHEHV